MFDSFLTCVSTKSSCSFTHRLGTMTVLQKTNSENLKNTVFLKKNMGWLSDPFQGLSDLQLGDEEVTLNHLVDRQSSGCCRNTLQV